MTGARKDENRKIFAALDRTDENARTLQSDLSAARERIAVLEAPFTEEDVEAVMRQVHAASPWALKSFDDLSALEWMKLKGMTLAALTAMGRRRNGTP